MLQLWTEIGPISWKFKLQKSISLSTTEYHSTLTAAIQVIYLRNLLKNLQFGATVPTPVFEDNTACTEWETKSSVDESVLSTSISTRTSRMRPPKMDTSSFLRYLRQISSPISSPRSFLQQCMQLVSPRSCVLHGLLQGSNGRRSS